MDLFARRCDGVSFDGFGLHPHRSIATLAYVAAHGEHIRAIPPALIRVSVCCRRLDDGSNPDNHSSMMTSCCPEH
jgi:hypothetical protein